MSSTVSTNMGLIIPGVGGEAGPTYASDINSSLTLIDAHDHSPGYGALVTPAGLNINSTLTFAGNAAAALSFVNYTPQASVTQIEATYVKGVDLYYRDGNNNEIAITTGGSVNGASGTITGLPSGTAGANFSGGVFTFSAATNTPANIQMGSALLGNNSALSKYLTLQPPNAMAANYSLTLPSLPGANGYMTLSTAGIIASVATIPGSALTAASVTATQIASATITSTQIASATIVGGNIANNTITPAKMTIQNLAISPSSGTYTNAGGNVILAVPNLSVSLTLSASKYVMMMIGPDGTGNPYSFTADDFSNVYFYVGGASQGVIQTAVGSGTYLPPFSQVVAPNTTSPVTYEIRLNPNTNNVTIKNAALYVWEI